MAYQIIDTETEIVFDKFANKADADARCEFMNSYHKTYNFKVGKCK